jgi:hypothetical protein
LIFEFGSFYIDYRHPDEFAIPIEETHESRIVLPYLKHRKLSKSAKTLQPFREKTLGSP